MNDFNYDVSIIYVNYKNTDLVINSIDSVKKNTIGLKYEIIIVDNSEDKTIIDELKSTLDEDVIIIDSGSNLGFGRANNLGSKVAKGKYLFFLNTDTYLINNAIFEMYGFMEKNSECGICGPNLFTKDYKPNGSFTKREYNIKQVKRQNSLLFFLTKHLFNRNSFFNKTEKPLLVNGCICGASLMIRSDLFNLIGGFDNDIFMFAEETLLCYRVINDTKYKLFNVPTAKIVHLEGASFKGMSEIQSKYFVDGNFVYFNKVYGEKGAIKYLHLMRKICKKKILLSRILRKKGYQQKYSNMYSAYIEKIKENEKKGD